MDSDNLINSRLGKYIVQSEIGRGGMAVVYRGYDPDLNRTVAIKVLPPHLMWREEFVERFLREARAAAQLQHPNIVTIHNVGQQDEWYYFVMEYVEGQTLTDLIEQRGPFPSQEAINILRPLADALDFAHKRGLVHRDIKPSNIISDPDVQAKLTDFGIARAGQETRLTATGAVMGTPEYMSPEQAKGRTVAAPSDQYSLAVVAYELLCGCVPFQAESTLALLHKVAYEPPPPIRQTRPELPAEVDTVLARALAKEPEQRYPTVTAFVDSLERTLAGAGIAQPVARVGAAVPPVRPPTPPERLRAAPPPQPDHGQRRLLIALVALAGVAALVVLVAVFFLLSGGSQATEAVPEEQTPRSSPTLTPRPATPSPSAESTTNNTPPPQDTATPEASVPASEDTPTPTPTSTSTPLPSATATPTRTPTVTKTPTRTPTKTLTPSPTPCAVPVHGAFSSAWQANANKLGCPTASAKSGIWMAQEDFQQGKMFWRQDNDKIYVLYNNGQWKRYDNTWQEGDPEFTCGPAASPPTPKRGFGKVWCSYSNVRQGLGDATSAEWGESRLTQQFTGGSAMQTGSGHVYLLFKDGSWK